MPRWLRALIGIALLAALAWAVDWRELPSLLSRLSWTALTLAMLVTALEMPVNAWKWQWALRLHDLRFTGDYLLRTSCIGYFLNNFLPSAIGGDVYRIYRTTSPGGPKWPAISTVLVERGVGLVVMLCNGLIGALLIANNAFAHGYIVVVTAALLAGAVILAGLYLGWFKGLTALLLRSQRLAPAVANLQRILRPRREWLPLIGLSFVFQSLVATVLYLSFAATGADISIAQSLLVAAAAGIASVLPISISGLGVVEGSIAGAAVALGADYEAAILAALVARLAILPVSAACGLVYLFDTTTRSAASSPNSVS